MTSPAAQRPRPVAVIGVVLAGALIALLLVIQHHHHSHKAGSPPPGGNNGGIGGQTATSVQPPSSSTTSRPSDLESAKQVAQQYITIAHERSYLDASLSVWVAREKPYVTAAYYQRLVARLPKPGQYSNSDEQYMKQLKANQTHIFVTVLSTGEALGDDTKLPKDTLPLIVYYQTTTYTIDNSDGVTMQALPVKLTMVKRAGKWLVDTADGA